MNKTTFPPLLSSLRDMSEYDATMYLYGRGFNMDAAIFVARIYCKKAEPVWMPSGRSWFNTGRK